jgi:hypothetical protein
MSTKTMPPRSARFMTFGELAKGSRLSSGGTCRFCKGWIADGYYYGTRHFVCVDCAKARVAEKLPMVERRERAARGFANRVGEPLGVKFIAHLAGVTVEYAQWAIDQQALTKANQPPADIAL